MPPETSTVPDASAAPTPSPSIADTLRAYAAGIIADPLNRKGLSKAWADAPQTLATARGVVDKIAGYLPLPQSIRDHVSDIEDLGQDTVGAALSKNPMDALKAQATSIGRGVRQGVAGFNEGLAPVFTAPADALASLSDAVGNKVAGYFGSPPVNLPMPSKIYNDAFVAPSGPPQTKGQKLMRAGGNAVGQSVPMMAGGLGLATSGARSGISMAQQAAGGLVDSIEAPAATSTTLSDTLRNAIPQTNTWLRSNVPLASSVIDAHTAMIPRVAKDYLASKAGNVAGTAGNLVDMVNPANIRARAQGLANALNPTNVAAAFNPANLQGAADATLDTVAANPMLSAQAKAIQSFHTGVKNQRALLNQPQQQPAADDPYGATSN